MVPLFALLEAIWTPAKHLGSDLCGMAAEMLTASAPLAIVVLIVSAEARRRIWPLGLYSFHHLCVFLGFRLASGLTLPSRSFELVKKFFTNRARRRCFFLTARRELIT